MNEYVFDIEGDSLTPTKIYCLSYMDVKEVKSLTSYESMRELLLSADRLIGHNIRFFDIPVLERILNIKIKAELVDTLALSWYLEPERNLHGLDRWGQELGVSKPKIDDWENLSLEEYIHRCEEDVKINTLLWERFKRHLSLLYNGDYNRLIKYLSFKLDCVVEQRRSKWKLDVEFTRQNLDKLLKEKNFKIEALRKAMPKVEVVALKTKPVKPFKKDGTPSETGKKWFQLLLDKKLDPSFDGEIKVVTNIKEGNPNSHIQIKDWLYSLGWKPITFKFDRNSATGELRKIPQVNLPFGEGICSSIKQLYPEAPSLELLDGLSVLSHRISILEGFLSNADEDGYVMAEIAGFTNTLRLKHKTIVNLPGVDKAYGEVVRGALIAPEGYELCGSDMSSLEDRTKQHFMYVHDPDYVDEMNTPDFDPHLDIALSSKLMTGEQVALYKADDGPTIKRFKPIRHQAKTANYSL